MNKSLLGASLVALALAAPAAHAYQAGDMILRAGAITTCLLYTSDAADDLLTV